MGLFSFFIKKKESQAPEETKPEIRSFGKEVKEQYTCEYYGAPSAAGARLFLSSREVTQPLYYIQVETPEGICGKDKEGLYLVELLPCQKNLSLAQCEGSYSGFSINNVILAACDVTDNFVSNIVCGTCGHEWKDGIRFNNKTVVRRPACKKV